MRLIIFSKDRAAQLDLLLTSIRKNDATMLFRDIVILHASSDEEYRKGYHMTIHRHPYATWVPEEPGKFRSQVLAFVNPAIHEFTIFMVDDMILYREPDFSMEYIKWIFKYLRDTLACVTLRLGKNTVHQYQTEQNVDLPFMTHIPAYDFYHWNWTTRSNTDNFGYPLSVDAHIFKTQMINRLLRFTQFDNPNTLEAALQSPDSLREVPRLMACRQVSCIVNTPINRVQDLYRNKAGTIFSMTPCGLNSAYLEGKRLDMEQMDFSNIRACHQELEVFFK